MGVFRSRFFGSGDKENKTEESNSILSDTSSCQKCEKLKEQFDNEQEKEKKIQEEYEKRELALKQKCNKYEEELQDLRQKRDESIKSLDIITKSELALKEKCNKYEEEVQDLRQKRDESMKSLDIITKRELNVKENCEEYKKKLQDMKEEKDETMRNNDILRESELALKEKCNKYEEELQYLWQKRDESMKSLDIITKREVSLIEDCEKYKKELQNVKQERDESMRKLHIFKKSQDLNKQLQKDHQNKIQTLMLERDDLKRKLEIEEKRQNDSSVEYKKYDMKLQQVTLELEQKEKRIEQLSKRLKREVSEQLNSGHLSENIYDPCRESELLNMYRKLKKESWPHLKDRVLRFKERKAVEINKLGATVMKNSFEKSQNVMKERIESIMTSLVLGCTKESEGSDAEGVLKKVHENQKFLQMKVLSCNKNFLMESVKDICQSQNLDEKEFSLFQEFAAECFRVSALMCLHSPELLPSWETEVDGFNFITGLKENMVIFPAIVNKTQIVCPAEIVSYNISIRK